MNLEQWLIAYGYSSLNDVERELRDRHEKIIAAERRADQLQSELTLLRAEEERRRALKIPNLQKQWCADCGKYGEHGTWQHGKGTK